MKRLWCLGLCSCFWLLPCYSALGQTFLESQFPFLAGEGGESEGDEDEIVTDRDSFTPATSTSAKGRLIFEAAHSFIDNRTVVETHSYPEILLRQGVTDWLELRAGWNYEVGGAGSPVSGNVPAVLEEQPGLERASKLLYGFKALLTEGEDWVPQSAVIVQGFTPTSGEETKTEFSTTYVFGWEHQGCEWDTAIRYSTSSAEEDDFNVWSPSTVIKFPIAERVKVHAEYFSILTDGREMETTQHFFSPGMHWLVTEDLEIGFRVGWGLNDDAPKFFSNAGIGVRF